MKECCRCLQTKSLDEFAKDKSRLDGLQPRCRQCQAILSTVWREANRESLREKSIEYRLANPEKRKASVLAYDMANREKNNARQAIYRAADPEKQKRRHATYRAANPEKQTARVARWRAANPDISREALMRYRTRKQSAYVSPVVLSEIYERDKGCCQICGKPVALNKVSLDHIIPLFLGGTHEPTNVQISHGRCNSSKGIKLLAQTENPIRMSGDR